MAEHTASISRRRVLQSFAAAPAAAMFVWTEAEANQAGQRAQEARRVASETKEPFRPQFFTPDELAMLTILVDIIIPADDRSGSASDAGVPEFIDFMMVDQPRRQIAMRGGLRWLDHECRDRFGLTFRECAEPQRLAVVDDIAWPSKARPELSHGVEFFSAVRDLTASGFFTTRMGIDDLQYVGNRPTRWEGPPKAALDHIGLTDASVARWYKEEE
jgi:gluconate 2-dehydrogenase gamma chain